MSTEPDPRYWKKVGTGIWSRTETPFPPLPQDEQTRLDKTLDDLRAKLEAILAPIARKQDGNTK